MLDVKQIIQDAKRYPHLDTHLYALVRLAQQSLQGAELRLVEDALILYYDKTSSWLMSLSCDGLRLPKRLWSPDAKDVISTLFDVPIVGDALILWGYPLWVYNNYELTNMINEVQYHLKPNKGLHDLFLKVDACLASTTQTNQTNPKITNNEPAYGDAQGSGINVHSQGELYPLYHMHWRGSDWLCYANHAVPASQFKQELLKLPPHDRTTFVVQYGVEIRPTKPEEKGCKSSVWPLEIREDKQRGMVFTWANLWIPYSKEFHKFLETRTADQRRACIQVVGDVLV